MNASTAAARTVVAALVHLGVRHVVLCPGSRSAPLAYALHDAERTGDVTLHVRHDERTAGFVALGVGRVAGSGPAAVVTTSGTAVANLHPAVLEAHHGDVPLLVLSADRPPPLRGTWANQTSELQAGLFGDAVRYAADLPVAGDDELLQQWTGAVREAVRAARGEHPAHPGRPGPAHLDLAFADPLTPDGDAPRPAPEPEPRPEPDTVRSPQAPLVLDAGLRTVVVAGDSAGVHARALAEAGGWPLLAEPGSHARSGPNAVGPYRLLLDEPDLGGRVERVVAFGRPTLSRQVTRLLADPRVELVLVETSPGRPDPGRSATAVAVPPVPRPPTGSPRAGHPPDGGWLARWLEAGAAATRAVDAVLDPRAAAGELTGPFVAREVAAALGPGERLVVASSNVVRDLDLAGAPFDLPAAPWPAHERVLANRGLSGIDGTLSTAVGVAAATAGPTRALVGDLAFLHDLGALAVPASERDGLDLQVVVLNDDGGGIFGLLEHGEPARAASFERVFGTPHGADLAALCAGFGIRHGRATTAAGLRAALAEPGPGPSVLEVRADRAGLRRLHADIRAAVGSELRSHAAGARC